MPTPSPLATAARYGLLAALGLAALGLLRGAVRVEIPSEQAAPQADPQPASAEPRTPLAERPVVASGSVLRALQLPVDGATPDALTDSFEDARGERLHYALDIMAPEGTPVRAAAGGTLARIHTSERGGKSLYQIGPDSAYVFYYAHLDAFAPDLEEGQAVERGRLLGTVGTTGNARTPHLHFGIWTFDGETVWDGTPVNPYPWLAE